VIFFFQRQFAVGVAASVDFAQSFDVDVGVNLRGFEAGVTQQLLHVANIGTTAMHVGGAGMAESMVA
jgi:hypothetical protein